MILKPNLEELIRQPKARELKFDITKLKIEAGFKSYDNSIPINPESSIIGLYYKDDLAGLLGFKEIDSTLHINQIQGRKGKKGYKLLACIEWSRVLIRSIFEYGISQNHYLFTATSSILETQEGCNVQDTLRLLQRYDEALKKEGFTFNSSNQLFEYIRR
ncbi:MAG: hypothetical protein LAT82_05150 [Nanoarchaeota archaeon]|nr:hypothetical protein [Nanoarchaeota archaeon]